MLPFLRLNEFYVLLGVFVSFIGLPQLSLRPTFFNKESKDKYSLTNCRFCNFDHQTGTFLKLKT